MKRVVLLLLVCCFSSLPLFGATPRTPKEEKVRELLRLTGAGDLGVQVMDGMLESMKASAPHVDDDVWAALRAELNPDELVDLVVPVYLKHIEEKDLDELIRFYRTPAAQRFVQKQGVVMTESMAAGQKWGELIAERAAAKIHAKKP